MTYWQRVLHVSVGSLVGSLTVKFLDRYEVDGARVKAWAAGRVRRAYGEARDLGLIRERDTTP